MPMLLVNAVHIITCANNYGIYIHVILCSPIKVLCTVPCVEMETSQAADKLGTEIFELEELIF